MIVNKKKPKIAFVVAADKINDFLNAETISAADAVIKSQEKRRKMMERAKCFTDTLHK